MQAHRYPFHLSIPVSELEPARRFYLEVLGARPGLVKEDYVNVLLWGHQITLQKGPDEVMPLERQGKRHFGVILPWKEWESEAARLESMGAAFLSGPEVLRKGTPEEQAKFFLEDPSHNIIEVKTYRDPSAGVGGDGW
jgi:uncharacterized protein